jgi:hypothetical protein
MPGRFHDISSWLGRRRPPDRQQGGAICSKPLPLKFTLENHARVAD